MKYEGEFSNGKIKVGKEYNIKSILVFEGEFFNETRLNGKGKEYYDNYNLKYEGDYGMEKRIL